MYANDNYKYHSSAKQIRMFYALNGQIKLNEQLKTILKEMFK